MLHLVCMDPLSVISLTKTQMRMPYRNKKCVQMLQLLKTNCKHVVVENEHWYTNTQWLCFKICYEAYHIWNKNKWCDWKSACYFYFKLDTYSDTYRWMKKTSSFYTSLQHRLKPCQRFWFCTRSCERQDLEHTPPGKSIISFWDPHYYLAERMDQIQHVQ